MAATTTMVAGAWWQYVLLFVAVAVSWVGVPFIGTAALGAAGVAASQGRLSIGAVVVVSIVAGEVGGFVGYVVGDRWGRLLLERPGRRQARRQRLVERGERVYARWGRLAVFVTPAIVSGIAKMRRGQFLVWNLVDSIGFTLAVAPTAYGLGRIATGHHSQLDVAYLVFGVCAGAAVVLFARRRHRRTASSRASASQ